ncbi:hypothetical protein ACHAWF_003104 [Thalassiosira exigua]
MPSSLAAALAVSKKGGPSATAVTSDKRTNESSRPSSLLQYQQTKQGQEKASPKEPQHHEQHGKQKEQSTKESHGVGGKKGKANRRRKNKKKGGNGSDQVDNQPTKTGGEKKRGNAQSTPHNNVDVPSDEIVFVCDIPSDSDDSNDDEDDVVVNHNQDLGVPNDDAEGESDSEDLDLDVVVIMGGDETNRDIAGSRGNVRGQKGRGGKGARSDRGNKNDRRKNNSENVGGRNTAKNHHHGREKDRRGGGSDHAAKDDRTGNGAGAMKPTNPALKPTPWSVRAKATESKANNFQKPSGRNNHAGPHSHGQPPTQHSRQKKPSATFDSESAPASALLAPKSAKEAAPPPKLESLALKGRWADEDSSDDE